MIIKKILFVFFISLNLNAAVIKHDILKPTFKEFPFREVCEKLGAKHFELIEAKSVSEIDCMGKVFSVIDFCLSKFPTEKTLTRAIIDEKTKMVKCEMSENVMLSISCDQRDAKYCVQGKEGCMELKRIYANKLDLAHSSLLEKNLNCYFASPL